MAEKIKQRSVSVRIDGKEVTNSLRAISSATSELYQGLWMPKRSFINWRFTTKPEKTSE
jgi:hypothetical protein